MDNRDLDPVVPEGTASSSPLRERARRLGEAARERALSTADERKHRVAGQVDDLASRLEGSGDLGARLSGWLRRAQHAMEDHSAEDLVRMAERQVKAHPAAFLAGCLALGFLGARLVRG
jgi:hypothetical protein